MKRSNLRTGALPLSAFALLAASQALGAGFGSGEGMRLGQPSYGGTGCPSGSASATLSPDATSLSILFDSFQVEAGGMSGKRIDRKSCNIAIPVTVPQGYTVSVMSIDYRGFNALPQGAYSKFSAEYFFAGSRGPQASRDFFGALNDNFTINNQLVAETLVWSGCGEDVNLRANTNMMVQTNVRGDQAMATLDSADVQTSVIFQLQWKRCGGGGGGGYDPYPPGPPAPGPGPGPQPQPDPYPPVNQGCTIDTSSDYYGRTLYNVRDQFGQVLGQFQSYAEASRAVTRFERNGQCRAGGGGGGGGYDPYPPVPPKPPRRGVQCTVSTQFGQFSGIGSDTNDATAQARNACIYQTNNSRACMQGYVSCHRM